MKRSAARGLGLGVWTFGAVVLAAMSHGLAAPAPELVGPPALEESRYREFTLENGLRVLLRPFEQADMAGVVVLYDVGDAHDPEGKSGLARLMTRLYLTSPAGERPVREVADLMQLYAAPASFNAAAGERHSLFGTVVPADRLERELAEAADRMAHLRVAASDIERERPEQLRVVRAMHTDIPQQATYVRTRELLRPSAPGSSIGGVASEILTISEADVAGHLRYYKPANAILVVSGAMDVGRAEAAVRRLFGGLEAGEKSPMVRPGRAPHFGEIEQLRLTSEVEGWRDRALLSVGYAAPQPGSEGYAAFQVLVGYLYQAINLNMITAREGSDILQAQVQYRTIEDPAIVQVGALVKADADPHAAAAEVRDLVRRAIDSIDDGLPLDTTLAERVFGSFGLFDIEDAELYEQALTVAAGMGRLRQMGIDPAALVTQMRAVTKADIIRCARQVFDDSNSAAVFTRVDVIGGIVGPRDG